MARILGFVVILLGDAIHYEKARTSAGLFAMSMYPFQVSGLGLKVVLHTNLVDQFKLSFQPVDVFLFRSQD